MDGPKIDARCPECGARRLTNWRYGPHHDRCGIGRAERRTREADQVWFDRGSRKVERPSTNSEVALVEAAGLALPAESMTVVRRYGTVERVIGGHGPMF